VVIGARRNAGPLLSFLKQKQDLGYKFMGFFDDEPDMSIFDSSSFLGRIAELKEYGKNNRIDEIFFALPFSYSELIREISEYADQNFISFKIVPDFQGLVTT